uniref:Uncharacterized protein n=1 Tax=Rhizophora mucronata TaxID=61149 RepID=A0A2P2PLQ4_RHIMU
MCSGKKNYAIFTVKLKRPLLHHCVLTLQEVDCVHEIMMLELSHLPTIYWVELTSIEASIHANNHYCVLLSKANKKLQTFR